MEEAKSYLDSAGAIVIVEKEDDSGAIIQHVKQCLLEDVEIDLTKYFLMKGGTALSLVENPAQPIINSIRQKREAPARIPCQGWIYTLVKNHG